MSVSAEYKVPRESLRGSLRLSITDFAIGNRNKLFVIAASIPSALILGAVVAFFRQ